MKGKFIVFEGIDRSGKTTQAKILAEKLKKYGRDVLFTFEPGDSPLGRKIREILLNSDEFIPPLAETFLFEADRNIHIEKVIKPALEQGIWVISDRYTYSTIAYQSGGKGVPLEIVEKLNNIATEKLNPDLVFLIDISPDEAMRRKGIPDRMEKEGEEFLEKVRNTYLQLARNNKNFVVIDGTLTVEKISEIIWKRISGL